ncbi:MAG: SUMF1/EgtB/PvdO family nonheme iron enzyme [Nanoarchaeota archaeon]|nr:SUMF1/EgtB/PvdO family nonheme iron enzyme [Nanoarchaeota archaeon]
MKFKNGITPVVATSLLLVVVVFAVVGFQSWYNNYQSSMFVKVESDSSVSSFNSGIETILDGVLYFRNTDNINLSYSDIKIAGVSCGLSGIFLSGEMNLKTLGPCANNKTGIVEVIVVTNRKIYAKKILINVASYVIDCSSLNGGEWILSPTNTFCVMKFEAKFVNYTGKSNTNSYNTWNWGTATGDKNITSSTSGGPIAYINQSDAELACQSLGVGYRLITNDEWMVIARNAELQSVNWNMSSVYNGSLMRGHSDVVPNLALSVSDVNDPYDGTGQIYPSIERRTLNLSNGEEIWDMSGNVWEWTGDNLLGTGALNSSLGLSDGWREWNTVNSSNYAYLMLLNSSLTSTNGIGQVYVDSGVAEFGGGNIHGLLRGGDWSNIASSGISALYLRAAPSFSYSTFGFRCSYTE